jgi:hypothetical protein
MAERPSKLHHLTTSHLSDRALWEHALLGRLWERGQLLSLLVGAQTGAMLVEEGSVLPNPPHADTCVSNLSAMMYSNSVEMNRPRLLFVTSCTRTKYCKELTCPQARGRLNERCIHTIEYYAAVEKNGDIL